MDEKSELRDLICTKICIEGLTEEDITFLLEQAREILDRRAARAEKSI